MPASPLLQLPQCISYVRMHSHTHKRTRLHSHTQGAGSKERESDPRKDQELKKKTQQPALSAAAVLNKGAGAKGPWSEVRESSGKPRGRPKVLKRPVTDPNLLPSSDTGKGRHKMDALDSRAHMDGLNRQEKRMHEAHDDSSAQPDSVQRAEKRAKEVS
jgi:hypothetical protein